MIRRMERQRQCGMSLKQTAVFAAFSGSVVVAFRQPASKGRFRPPHPTSP